MQSSRIFLLAFLPAAGFFQRINNFARHIALIMFGKDSVGCEYPACIEFAFGNNSLPFSEQVGDNALISHSDVGFSIRHCETHEQVVTTLYAAGFNKAANTHAGAQHWVFFGDISR